MTDPIHAPWTPEQVAALNAFQHHGGMHPFTCGGEHTPGSPLLVAREDGWHCSDPYGEGCDYMQDWAHASMADPSAWPQRCSCGGRFPIGHLHADVHQPVEQSARTTPNNPAATPDDFPYRRLLARLAEERARALRVEPDADLPEAHWTRDGIAAGLHLAAVHAISVFEGHEARQQYLATEGEADNPGDGGYRRDLTAGLQAHGAIHADGTPAGDCCAAAVLTVRDLELSLERHVYTLRTVQWKSVMRQRNRAQEERDRHAEAIARVQALCVERQTDAADGGRCDVDTLSPSDVLAALDIQERP